MSIVDDYTKWKTGYLDRVAERGRVLLQRDIRKEHYDSGNMYMSCEWTTVNENTRRIITDPLSHTNGVHYAPIVRDGRGPVYPKYKKALKWYSGGELFIRKYAGPYEGDPGFPTRAADQLRAEVPNL